MKKSIIIIFTITFFIVAINKYAIANSAQIIDTIDKAEQDCISKTANTYEMNKCSIIARQSWEKDIDKNIKELKKYLNKEEYQKLKDSQMKWGNYQKNEYKFINSMISSKQETMFLNIKEGLKTEIVKQRALIIRDYLNMQKD